MTVPDRRWTDADRELAGDALAKWCDGMGLPPYVVRPYGAVVPVLDALTAAGRLRENATADIEAAFRERRDDTGQRPLHPAAVAAYQHAIVIARRVPDA